MFYGLRLTWLSLNGSFLQILKQLLIVVLGLTLAYIGVMFFVVRPLARRVLGQIDESQLNTNVVAGGPPRTLGTRPAPPGYSKRTRCPWLRRPATNSQRPRTDRNNIT